MSDLARLTALLDAGRVKLGVNIRRMNSPGSPVYHAGENIWPAALILTASFAGTVLLHYAAGFALLLAGCAWWLLRVHPRIKDGVFDRTAALALSGETAFDALWAKGILTLHAHLPDGGEASAGRRDDWRGFVTALEQRTPPAG
jgi:hypothetical protein